MMLEEKLWNVRGMKLLDCQVSGRVSTWANPPHEKEWKNLIRNKLIEKLPSVRYEKVSLKIDFYIYKDRIAQFRKNDIDNIAKPVIEVFVEIDMIRDDTFARTRDVMDRDTRFLLASTISEKREIDDARRVFMKAKRMAKQKPETVTTDGLQSYVKAFKKEFYTMRDPRTKHVRSAGMRSRTNNNVERLNGAVREEQGHERSDES